MFSAFCTQMFHLSQLLCKYFLCISYLQIFFDNSILLYKKWEYIKSFFVKILYARDILNYGVNSVACTYSALQRQTDISADFAFSRKMQRTFDGQHKNCRYVDLTSEKFLSTDEDMSFCHLLKLDNTLNSRFMQTN